jgi:hypothetical protein
VEPVWAPADLERQPGEPARAWLDRLERMDKGHFDLRAMGLYSVLTREARAALAQESRRAAPAS